MGKKKTKVTARPAPLAQAEVTVFQEIDGVRSPSNGAKISGLPGRPDGQGGVIDFTSPNGKFVSDFFPAGLQTLRVTSPGFGPRDPSGGLVEAGAFSQEIDFAATTAIKANPPRTQVTVVLQLAHPVVEVIVIDVSTGAAALVAGASVEFINNLKGVTDAQGSFKSRPVAPGKLGVVVRRPGFLPVSQPGDTWFQEIEIQDRNRLESKTPNRTFVLRVEMINPQFGTRPALPGTHPRPVAVWVSGGATPHSVDEDARLDGPNGKVAPSFPARPLADTPQGQDGWDIGINYGIPNPKLPLPSVLLSRQLEAGTLELPDHVGGGFLAPNQIKRLAIVAHGGAGIMDLDQVSTPTGFGVVEPPFNQCLTLARLPVYQSQLETIGRSLHRDAIVYLVACRLAHTFNPSLQSPDDTTPIGEELLRAISRIWPTVRVVGIRTLGVVPNTLRNGHPGIRATRHFNIPPDPKEYEVTATANDLKRIPWFSEDAPHATVARDGNIIRRGSEAS